MEGSIKPPQEAVIHTERPMRIICIGAGPSGLILAYKLQRSFTNFSLTLYEKNAEVSGTWFENTYPGCRCDFPGVNYTYTFEPQADFSGVYPTAAETRRYFQDFRTRHGLGKYCRLRHQVVGARWSDEATRWEVQVEDLGSGEVLRDSCDILINACGYLNTWDWPEIPGLAGFKGPLLHSAKWDSQIDLTDKCVGLIGNGYAGCFFQFRARIANDWEIKLFGHTDSPVDTAHCQKGHHRHTHPDLDISSLWTRSRDV